MHQVYKTRGFVFKKQDRQEADRVFSVFAQDFGRIEIFAKSIRAIASKLKGGIETFSVSEVEFVQGKNHKTLTNAMLVEKFSNIIAVSEKMEIATKACSLLDCFIKEQQPDQDIWEATIDFFKKLNHYPLLTTNYQLVYYYFFWNLISTLGYKPELFKCAHCTQHLNINHLYFSNKEGGIVCESCFSRNNGSVKVNTDTVKILRLFLKNDWQTMLKLKIEPASSALVREVSDGYHSYLSGILV